MKNMQGHHNKQLVRPPTFHSFPTRVIRRRTIPSSFAQNALRASQNTDRQIHALLNQFQGLQLTNNAPEKKPTVIPAAAAAAAGAGAVPPTSTKKAEERAVLTTGGEVVGGFSDFKPGTSVVVLKSTAMSIPAEPSIKYLLLRNWRPLVEVVPMWRYYADTELHRNLRQMFVLDCGGGGDCLFFSVAAGYNQAFQSLLYHMEGMRDLAAEQLAKLSPDEIKEFAIDLHGKLPDWFAAMPQDKERLAYLQALVRKTGNAYWGETGTLRQLLLKAAPFVDYKIGFAVINIRRKPTAFRPLTDFEKSHYLAKNRQPPKEVATKHEPKPEITIFRRADTQYLLFLHVLDNVHWVLLGFSPTSMVQPVDAPIGSTFAIDSFPKPLYPFLNESSP